MNVLYTFSILVQSGSPRNETFQREVEMLRHRDIWRAIDRLAAEHGLSVSDLARRAGLDPATFGRSRRANRDGRPRWPGTESIAKILAATGADFAHFAALAKDGSGPALRILVIGYAQAGRAGYFDDAGYPTGSGWDMLDFPNLGDPHAYGLEISGDSMEPVYRNGDIIIVSPQSAVREGDRVVLKTREEEVMAKQLARRDENRIELMSVNRAHEDVSLPTETIIWMSRIVWVSQ